MFATDARKTAGIISPVYNVEPFLEEYFNSITAQSYENFKVFCVNDGSTDNSGEMLTEFSERDPRFTVIHQENKTCPIAVNVGLDAAVNAGVDYIAFIDPDDYVELGYLEGMIHLANAHNADIVCVNFYRDYPDRVDAMANQITIPSIIEDKNDLFRYGFEADIFRGFKMYCWNKLFNARFFREENIRMGEMFSTGGDMLITAECLMLANRVCYNDEPLYHYRIRNGSLVRSHDFKKRTGMVVSFEKIIKLLSDKNFDLYVIQLVKRFHTYYSSQLAEFAYEIKNIEALHYSQNKMMCFLDEYIDINSHMPERIERINRILDLHL